MSDDTIKPRESVPDWQEGDEELPEKEAAALARYIRLLPEPPVPEGFSQAALANWRSMRDKASPLLSPAAPQPLGLGLKLRILLSQGWWKDGIWGVLLFAAGCFLLRASALVPSYFILPVAGCIPILTLVHGTARHTLCGMGELVRSLRISLQWYLHGRLLLAGLAATGLNFGAMLALHSGEGARMLFRLFLLWCTPLLINTALSLALTARVRHTGQLAALLGLLPVGWLIILSDAKVGQWATSASLFTLSGAAVASAVLLGILAAINGKQIKKGGILLGA